jgi:hypothetical protein
MNGFSSDATELPTSPVSEELREKVTPLSANAAMRIAASFSEAEAGGTAGDSRPIAGSSGWPLPAQSGGPPRWIARIKLVPKLTVRVRFPSPLHRRKALQQMGFGQFSCAPFVGLAHR